MFNSKTKRVAAINAELATLRERYEEASVNSQNPYLHTAVQHLHWSDAGRLHEDIAALETELATLEGKP